MAETTWKGTVASSSGRIRPATGALGELPVTRASRTADPGGKTRQEEPAAAAPSSCFAMALALRVGEREAVAARVSVIATMTLEKVDGRPTMVSSDLQFRGLVPGVDAAGFQQAVDEAASLCPASRLCAGAGISVAAILESAP